MLATILEQLEKISCPPSGITHPHEEQVCDTLSSGARVAQGKSHASSWLLCPLPSSDRGTSPPRIGPWRGSVDEKAWLSSGWRPGPTVFGPWWGCTNSALSYQSDETSSSLRPSSEAATHIVPHPVTANLGRMRSPARPRPKRLPIGFSPRSAKH